MGQSPDYKELLQTLNQHGVEYLVVGGHAVMKYAEPRYTKDLDLWVRNSAHNSKQLIAALARFGAPLQRDGVTPETFTRPMVVYQIGVAPVRIDISTYIDGVQFAAAWRKRVPGRLFGVGVHFLSLSDLIRNKRASGRTGDLADLESLAQVPLTRRRSPPPDAGRRKR